MAALFENALALKQEHCRQILLKSGLAYVYTPGTLEYTARLKSYWSANAQLSPSCIVLPRDTSEVSLAVKTLVEQTDCKFAIRSGGHSSNAGWSNIDAGVTIDLSLLNKVTYNPLSKTASLGPGANWLDVYRVLETKGIGVAGGRIGDVGVGGFLTGGGISYYVYRHGLSCDNVRAFEVVLADGRIVEASAESHADLFRALKGGGNAFGIVTRFDMETFAARPIWGGAREYAETASADQIQALEQWTENLQNYPDGSAVLVWTHRFLAEQTIILSVFHDVEGAMNHPAFDVFFDIPGSLSDTMMMTNMTELALISQASGKRNVWFTLTLRNENHILTKAAELHKDLVDEMRIAIGSENFETQCLLQPFPAFLGQMSAAKGNNVLGIDAQTSNGVVLLGSLAVNTVHEEQIGRAKMLSWKHALEEHSSVHGGLLDFQYMNYADCSQDVLESYGERNRQFMREVNRQYDESGVFLNRVPGGFKLD